MHIPVLLHESIQALNLKNGSTIVDGTLGLGGHSKEIVQQILPTGLLIGIDQDTRNLVIAKRNLEEWKKNILFVHSNFDQLPEILQEHNIESVDGILLDIGIASTHVDEAERGFSFHADGPLDMRMNPENPLTAAEIVNTYSEKEIADILYQLGEERQSYKIAKAILARRKEKKFETTRELATTIEQAITNTTKNKHPALLSFQALRIAVNDELGALKRTLKASVKLLNPGGRLVVISYHSLEDRIVKQFFHDQTSDCVCPRELPLCRCRFRSQLRILEKKPIIPTAEEIQKNSRSRSAKMRIAERTENPWQNYEEEKRTIENQTVEKRRK